MPTKNNINTNDISVVVQGPIDKCITSKCLEKIRKLIIGAEIILSTWEGSDVTGLDYDKVVFSKDPGGFKDRMNASFFNNTLRQLISTEAGIKVCNRKYILKMRSDIILKSLDFFKYIGRYSVREKNFIFLKNKVIISSFFTKRYLSHNNIIQPVPFHISDWIAFGTNEDIKKLYCLELPKEPYFSWYFTFNNYDYKKINLLNCSHQYAPEQYIMTKAFSKQYDLNFINYMDYNEKNIKLSNDLIQNNFIILDPWQFRFISGKVKNGRDYYQRWSKFEFCIPRNLWNGLYTNYVYEKKYSLIDREFKIEFSKKIKHKILKFIHIFY